MRGKVKDVKQAIHIMGSPPRMRGKGIVHVLVPEEFGITPACAGKRADCPTWGCTGWDHPRVCGEKMCIQCSKSIPQGSPPRMRGKDVRCHAFAMVAGITPAYAGKRCRPPHQAPAVWDHPRVCGEKNAQGAYNSAVIGSPPRMRGKGQGVNPAADVFGITPAYAGKRFAESG